MGSRADDERHAMRLENERVKRETEMRIVRKRQVWSPHFIGSEKWEWEWRARLATVHAAMATAMSSQTRA